MPAAIPIAAAAISAYGAIKASKNNKDAAAQSAQTSTQQNQVDPRIEAMLFGEKGTRQLKSGAEPIDYGDRGNPIYSESDYETVGGRQGLLDQYQGLLNTPQSEGLSLAGKRSDEFIGANSSAINDAIMQGSSRLMQGNVAPQMKSALMNTSPQLASLNTANFVSSAGQSPSSAALADTALMNGNAVTASAQNINAPSQNNLDLKNAYDKFISGNSAENPYLTGAIQKGLNQSSSQFYNLTEDAKNALQEGLLGVRGGAIASGQYGGSRQAIAESKVNDSIAKQLGRALSQVGQNQTDSALAAQSGAYDQGQNRAVNALNSLGGNQYNVAAQNAQAQNNMSQFNAGAQNNQSAQNAQMQNQVGMFNAGAQNNMKQYYSGLGQNNNQFNAQANNANNQFNAQSGNANNQFNTSIRQNLDQFNAGQQQNANQSNLQSSISNNAQNANMLQNGMAGLGNLFNTNYNQAQAAGNYGINRAQQVNGLLAPYMSANSSSTSSQPMYQNNGANALGYATLGLNAAKNVDWGNLFNGNVQPERSTYVSPSMGQTYTNNFTAPNVPNIDMKTDWNFG